MSNECENIGFGITTFMGKEHVITARSYFCLFLLLFVCLFFFACLIFGKFVRYMPSYNFRVTIQERSSRYLRVLSIQEHGNLLTLEFSEQFLRKILCAV